MGGTDSNGGRHLRMNFPLLLLLFPLLDITSSGLGWRNPNWLGFGVRRSRRLL
jgi:hypothetical protein